MNNRLFALALVAAPLGLASHQAAAQGTAFTYQGSLNESGAPANGSYDLTFTLFASSSGGSARSGPITNAATGVSNGLFTVPLDFGSGVFNGATYWLEIGVRTNGGAGFATLAPRQELTPAPYAVFAEGSSNMLGVVPGGGLSGAYSGAVTFSNVADSFSGAFMGNGGGLSNVNAAALGGLAAGKFWQLGGNSVGAGQILGSTNNQAVELWANGARALRLEPGTNGAPNLIGGSSVNYVSSGVVGATIAGGGTVNYEGSTFSNRVTAVFGTVGGGIQNTAANLYATVAGGVENSASGAGAFVGGGAANMATIARPPWAGVRAIPTPAAARRWVADSTTPPAARVRSSAAAVSTAVPGRAIRPAAPPPSLGAVLATWPPTIMPRWAVAI